MSEIEFETDHSLDDLSRGKNNTNAQGTSGMVRFIMKLGAPNAETANYILIGFAVIILIIAASIIL